ncbi:MAG: rRNA maturation RNase YbeY [Salibacteraceae bacterium]|jgi:probable rRNA maturation factor|nr:rRNA maturation RNase YbeY [Salibacteraceae bacterium]MDP4763936.1 rRNA maturation RNase YbeY [Salibacteraceae bacterium]MDP4843241.1 rRNA maturation RNase YbeY [Salibacteraceae bacterium]MDP4934205.1 rRNA maturation RNase YbeY [Salibacteraceae bacterium]MDP4964591.1 rRNA maturation RNase YbeY [Salibacteraceae bacterium]
MIQAILEIFNQSENSSFHLPEEKLLSTINQIYQDHQMSFEWINVILLNSDEHTTMNAQYLNHDYPTDILTFEFEEGEKMNGELYLNVDVAQSNSTEYKVSLENELSRLIIHGALHLTGQGDHSDEERRQMKVLEDRYLKFIYD